MKKILLSLILSALICYAPAFSNEIEDDYFDIASSSKRGDSPIILNVVFEPFSRK